MADSLKNLTHELNLGEVTRFLVSKACGTDDRSASYLRCITGQELQQVMDEVHVRTCGAHQTGLELEIQLKRMVYY